MAEPDEHEAHPATFFDRFAERASDLASDAAFFIACVLLVVVWVPSILAIQNVDTWQLLINTATTIVTFLMVFVIQNTQNRDGAALQIKLDELVRALEGAHNGLLDLEELSEAELETFRKKYVELAEAARNEIRTESETGTPRIEFPETR